MTTDTKVYNILLAEDNTADADLVRAALREHNVFCALDVVQDGVQAIEVLRRWDNDSHAPQLDLCILDMHLPKRDGEEILKILRSTEKYAQTPVIVMSGIKSPAAKETALKNAALVFFEKPSSVDEYFRLGAIVRRVLMKVGSAAV